MSYWAEVLAENEQCDEIGRLAYEFEEEICPHGCKIKHCVCNIPGYRSRNTSTDCPICKKKDLRSIEIFPKDRIR